MSKLTKEKISLFLKQVHTYCRNSGIVRGMNTYLMSDIARKIDIPYFLIVRAILTKKGILEYRHYHGAYFWKSTVEPNLKMAEAIIEEIQKEKDRIKPEVNTDDELLFIIRRALILLDKRHGSKYYADSEGNIITEKAALIIR